jgi:glycine cleavage system H protein
MDVEGCPLPEDRLYELESEVWLAIDPPGRSGRIGVMATLGAFVGRFTSVTFRNAVGPLRKGQSVAVLESTRSVGPVRMPVDGAVIERNPALEARPKLINDRPYDEGWIVRVALDDPEAARRELETAPAIRDRLAERIRSRRIRCLPAVADAEMFEIGAECQAILVRLDEEIARRAPGEVIHLVTDDPTAPVEMVRWTDRTGHTVLDHRTEGSLHHFLVRREAHPTPARPRG